MEQFTDAFRKYGVFRGRATRSDFWWFFVVVWIISILLMIVDIVVLGTPSDRPGVQLPQGFLGAVFALVSVVPSLALLVRRIHDTGRSGWWTLLVVVPCIGPIAWLVFGLQGSEPRENQWGPLELR